MSALPPIRGKTDLYEFENYSSTDMPSVMTTDDLMNQTAEPKQVDGTFVSPRRQHVLGAAARLCPQPRPTTTTIGQARKYKWKRKASSVDSESTQLVPTGPLRNDEIVNILAEVKRYEKARRPTFMAQDTDEQMHVDGENVADPDLLITRPRYVEPPDERYKKQGLGRWDQRKSRKQYPIPKSSAFIKGRNKVSEHDMATPSHPPRFYCCREPEGVPNDTGDLLQHRTVGQAPARGIPRQAFDCSVRQIASGTDTVLTLTEYECVAGRGEGTRTKAETAGFGPPDAGKCHWGRAVSASTRQIIDATLLLSEFASTYQSTDLADAQPPTSVVSSSTSALLTSPCYIRVSATEPESASLTVTGSTDLLPAGIANCTSSPETVCENLPSHTVDGEAPTPIMRPAVMTKPWGTPLNIKECQDSIREPESPSPHKRKHLMFSLDVATKPKGLSERQAGSEDCFDDDIAVWLDTPICPRLL